MNRKLQSLKACYALFVCLIVQLDPSCLGYHTGDNTFFLAQYNQLRTADTPKDHQDVYTRQAEGIPEGGMDTAKAGATDGQTSHHHLSVPYVCLLQ